MMFRLFFDMYIFSNVDFFQLENDAASSNDEDSDTKPLLISKPC